MDSSPKVALSHNLGLSWETPMGARPRACCPSDHTSPRVLHFPQSWGEGGTCSHAGLLSLEDLSPSRTAGTLQLDRLQALCIWASVSIPHWLGSQLPALSIPAATPMPHACLSAKQLITDGHVPEGAQPPGGTLQSEDLLVIRKNDECWVCLQSRH